ncbi:hypothetical protein HUT06_03555 [Actinomadura sp. NAK00032]|uniref:hypothetical protein n=1 Tax=Actinomadura sp. NAK00032 TaxID=2742128 RepID=UPI001590A0C2|nr:hypothetical protein [Actinomadura sp. NAK00032]QKW33226.1 hypothetical protein HUT06_03555 [Actinomadura sp. NAK00032]
MRPNYALGVLGAALLLLTAACGGGGSDNPGAADPMASFRACLEKQGVKLPEGGRPSGAPRTRPSDAPTNRPSGAPSNRPSRSAEEQKAMQACASLAPQRGEGRGGPPGGGPR